jgi:hypothetical protein
MVGRGAGGSILPLSSGCHSEWPWACSPPMEMKVGVILREAKDLQFAASRSLASLRIIAQAKD